MINRREFLEGAAVSALPALAAASPRVSDAPRSAQSSGAFHAIIDPRFAPASVAGARLSTVGATVHAIPDGDVTQVWLRHIGPGWKERPITVVGLSARPALFCLEQLALGSGLRVVFHAEHVVYREGRAAHTLLRGAQSAGISAHDLALAGRLWPGLVADILAAHADKRGCERHGRSEAGLSPALAPGAQLLTSWIISA